VNSTCSSQVSNVQSRPTIRISHVSIIQSNDLPTLPFLLFSSSAALITPFALDTDLSCSIVLVLAMVNDVTNDET
jgi:hypothetical protein